MNRAVAAWLLTLGFAGAPAWADDGARPRTQPSRDVEVVYAMDHGTEHLQQRSRWQVSTGRQRVDSGTGGSYMIADRQAGTVAMVSDAARQVIDIKTPAGPLEGGKAQFTRLGQLTIAGLVCTEWAVIPAADTRGTPNQICMTDDGVLLGIRADNIQRALAISVRYGPADPAAFVVPADYRHVGPPAKAPSTAP